MAQFQARFIQARFNCLATVAYVNRGRKYIVVRLNRSNAE